MGDGEQRFLAQMLILLYVNDLHKPTPSRLQCSPGTFCVGTSPLGGLPPPLLPGQGLSELSQLMDK